MPRRYVPDDHVVRNALGMARDRDPLPAMGTYSSYPYLVPYLLLPVYAGQYALGKLAGDWEDAEGYGDRVLDEPGVAQVPARAVVGLLGALTVLAVFGAGRALGLGGGAHAAAWLTATCLLAVQLSTHARPWVPLVLFGTLSLWAAVRYTRSGRFWELGLSGAAAGLSFACHQAGLAMLAIPGCAWLFAPTVWRGRALRAHLGHGLGAVACFALTALLLGHGYYLRHGATAPEAVVGAELGLEGKLSIGGQATVLGVSFESAERLSRKLFGYDPVLVALALVGVLLALRERRWRAPLLALLLVGGFFITNPSDHVRYLLPATPFLALAGGLACERCGRGSLTRIGLGALLMVPLVQALRLGWLLRQEDSRAQAERALEELPAGAWVAIDHYGPTPDPSLAALQKLFELRPLYTRELARADRLQTGALPGNDGLDVLRVEELLEVHPRTGVYGVRERLRSLGSTPAELFARLGLTHLVLVDRRPTRDAPWLVELADAGRPLATFNPAPGSEPPREAFLPTEMDFPLTALWEVERPGPWMRLVELPR